MTNMINSAPRFGYENDPNVGERIFDYATSRYTKVGDRLRSVDGEYDTVKLAELIKRGGPVTNALITDAGDEVDQFKRAFLADDEPQHPESVAGESQEQHVGIGGAGLTEQEAATDQQPAVDQKQQNAEGQATG